MARGCSIDDPELDPIWEAFARLSVPVLIHIAEPPAFFEPLDYTTSAGSSSRSFPIAAQPACGVAFEELMTERNNMFRKHPKTSFILAHFGWHANDLARRPSCSTTFRTSTTKSRRCSTTSAGSRAPRTTSSSSTRTGSCSARTLPTDEYPYYWRVFETNDEYFDYYRDYHAFWKLYGIGLPDDVLKKLYYENALRVVKGLPQTGWPQ